MLHIRDKWCSLTRAQKVSQGMESAIARIYLSNETLVEWQRARVSKRQRS